MNFKTHKDNLPHETIKRIKNILSELGIFLYEKKWFSFSNNCYSLNLASMELPGYFSNGKGVTGQYALASAYAEFMERLQSGFLFRKNFGLMEEDNFSYSDEIEMKLGDYAEKNKIIIENLTDLIMIKKYKDLRIKFLPSYEAIEGKIKFLPTFLSFACGGNGLCAGNTPEEAICQGICEIFERYVVKEIYFNDKIDLPTIPLSVLNELEIYNIIDEIIYRGYDLIIKDCTLNGKFPVVGVILLNKNKNSYLYSFGSDPIFEVALQRCLTELFQGIDESSINQSRWIKLDLSTEQFLNKQFLSKEDNKKLAYQCFYISRAGELPNKIFMSKYESKNFKNAFQDTFKNHSDSLHFLISIIKQNQYKIYIRDISNLGFPTFRIFIPELSVINKIEHEKMRALYIEKSFIKKILLRLKKSSDKEIEKCANLLEPLTNIPEDYYFYKSFTSRHLVEIIIDEVSHFKNLDHLLYLLGMLFFRIGNYEKAFKYLDLYIKEEGYKLGNLGYYSCVLLYIKLKANNFSTNDITLILKNTYGENLSQKVITSLSNQKDCFKYFILPECGNCSICPIKKECYYDKWNEINTKIVQKIKNNPIKQEKLANIFKKNFN